MLENLSVWNLYTLRWYLEGSTEKTWKYFAQRMLIFSDKKTLIILMRFSYRQNNFLKSCIEENMVKTAERYIRQGRNKRTYSHPPPNSHHNLSNSSRSNSLQSKMKRNNNSDNDFFHLHIFLAEIFLYFFHLFGVFR